MCKNLVFNCICKTRRVTRYLQYLQNTSHVRHTTNFEWVIPSENEQSETMGQVESKPLYRSVFSQSPTGSWTPGTGQNRWK